LGGEGGRYYKERDEKGWEKKRTKGYEGVGVAPRRGGGLKLSLALKGGGTKIKKELSFYRVEGNWKTAGPRRNWVKRDRNAPRLSDCSSLDGAVSRGKEEKKREKHTPEKKATNKPKNQKNPPPHQKKPHLAGSKEKNKKKNPQVGKKEIAAYVHCVLFRGENRGGPEKERVKFKKKRRKQREKRA